MNKITKGLLEGKLLTRANAVIRKKLKLKSKGEERKWEKFLADKDQKLSESAKARTREKLAIQPNLLIIATNTFNYTCNPKYIYQELQRNGGDLDIYWLVDNIEKKKDQYPAGTRFIELGSAECFEKVYSARAWLNNGIVFSEYFDKKPGQLYFQTMHGSLGIKRMDNAVLARNAKGEEGQRVVRREEENTDMVFTNSDFEERVFRSIFWHDTPMERLGHARTDILFKNDNSKLKRNIRRKLAEKYGIAKDYKLVLFAPTHRSGMSAEDLDIDFPRFTKALTERFGGKYCILLRLHDRSFALRDKMADTLQRGIMLDPEYELINEQEDIGEYIDNNVDPDERFWYRAVAYTPVDIKAHYHEAEVLQQDGVLDIPQIESLTPEFEGLRIRWKPIPGAARYEVYRRVEGGEWELRRRLLADFTEMQDPSVKNGKYNTYRICALDEQGRRSDLDAEGLTIYFNRPRMYEVRKDADSYFVSWKKDRKATNYKVYRTPASYIVDMSEYPDIQELMMVADIGITDYSSWIYDYVNTGKPGFLYVPDIDRYNSKTGLYYTLDKTPFPACEDTDDLVIAVQEFDEAAFSGKVKAFLEDKEAVDDGHSAERVAARIIELMKEDALPPGENQCSARDKNTEHEEVRIKAGTISFNINAPDFNYGAILHSWAFQQYLLGKGNIETEIIDYTMPRVEGWNRYEPARSSGLYKAPQIDDSQLDAYFSRLKKFDRFIETELKVSDEKYTQKSISKAHLPYDVIICESDVIWSHRRNKLDPVLFLAAESMQGKRRIAYAPSAADAVYTDKDEANLDILLDNIHFISCRESYLKTVLEKHTKRDITHVLDPVMLLNAEDYDKITAHRIIKEDYLLLYLPVSDNEQLRTYAFDYAKRHGLKILEISTKLQSFKNENELCIGDAGVEEFLSAVKYASVVFTNSFHAICFSIIYSHQFYAFTRQFNGKVIDICHMFGLEEYFFADDIFIEREPYDVDIVKKKFAELQAMSRRWLDNALTEEIPEKEYCYNPEAITEMYDTGEVPPNSYKQKISYKELAYPST